MTKTLLLEHLECANCAAKIEAATAKLEGVSEVSVSFFTAKMTLCVDEAHADGIVKAVQKNYQKI